MNKKHHLIKRIFILGLIFTFFTSSYLYAGKIKPRRGRKPSTSSRRLPKGRTVSTSGVSATSPANKSPLSQIDLPSLPSATPTKTRAKRKTKQEWVEAYYKNPEELRKGTGLYKAFQEADQRVKKAEKNGTEVNPLDKQMSDRYRENTKRVAVARTKEEWLATYYENPEELRAGTPMYEAFTSAYKRVKKAEKNGEEADPLDKQMLDIYLENTKRIAVARTKEEWLAAYYENPEELHAGTPMYEAFRNANLRVKNAEKNGKEVNPLDKQMSDIYRENTKRIAVARTPQEWLAEYEANQEELPYGTPMYEAFRNADQRVKKAEKNGEEVDPWAKQMSNIFREKTTRHAEAKTMQETYDIFLQYLRYNRSYPVSKSVEYKLVYNRLHKRGNLPTITELDANPELRHVYESDPELYKLYKLDQLARAAKRGEKPWEVFDRDNPLRRQRIGEQQTTQQVPELSAEELHKIYTEMPAEVQTVIRQTEEHYEQVWNNYPTWFEQNKQNIIFTPDTKRAFDVLNREVEAGRWNEDLVQILADLDQMKFGDIDNVSYKVIYRGNSSQFPKEENFHLVAEEQGVDIPHIKSIITGKVPHIRLFTKGNKLTRMVLEEGVTSQDIQQVIEPVLSYLGENWEVRMGTHEKGTKPHLHIEWVDNESGLDMSYTLQLDVQAVTPEGPHDKREQGFRKLFGKYLE